jgi:CRISPR/Cas system-associated endonuclease/helicase Cas3
MIDIYKEHRKAIKHWQVSRGGASKALCEAIEKEFKISIDLEKIDETLNALLDGNFLEWIDFSKATGEIAFDLISINRIFLGAFSVADAESARSQTFGEKISFNPLCPEKARVRSPQISSKDVGLNKLRSSFQNYVRENASGEKGAYLIKAPTGLGKTFAAARVIDKLQTEKGPCKIFYLAPTVTILNQISQEFRNLVEDENLLEIHYMANSPQESEKLSKEEIIQRELKLATWDAGMIITTYHRIISLFSNMAKKGCCNLYGLKEAIFIFDECQFISHIQYPVFSSLVSALAEYCGARFFFMSATPQDESMWNRGHRVLKWEKIPPITKLLHDNQLSKLEGDKMVDGRRLIHPKKDITLLEDLKREITRYRDKTPHKSVLVLLNLAQDARELYELLAKEGREPDYCITTYLRPKDVRENLKKASIDLRDAERAPILMIATSIVQAGVDLDFDIGFIELNDLATFRQGCGRVGRTYDETRGICDVYCFELIDDEIKRRPSWFRQRFASCDELSAEKEIYLEVIKHSVDKVLNSPDGLTDLAIEAIEKDDVEEIFKIYDETKNKLLPGFSSKYERLLGSQKSEKNGFCFDVVRDILTDPLNENDSVCPFLILFLPDEMEDRSRISDLISEIQEREKELLSHDESFFDSLKVYRKDKKRLQRLIAPFALRRHDIVRDFRENTNKIVQAEDFFIHTANKKQYSSKSTGWQFDVEQSESPGCIF